MYSAYKLNKQGDNTQPFLWFNSYIYILENIDIQSTSCEMSGCVKHKLESRLPGEISITSDVQMTPAESEEELKSLVMRVKEESEKLV